MPSVSGMSLTEVTGARKKFIHLSTSDDFTFDLLPGIWADQTENFLAMGGPTSREQVRPVEVDVFPWQRRRSAIDWLRVERELDAMFTGTDAISLHDAARKLGLRVNSLRKR